MGGGGAIMYLVGTASLLVYSLYLHRTANHRRANYVLLFTINIAVYLFAASEPRATGTMVFFMANSVAAFAWSGDVIQLHAENPDVRFLIPQEGLMLW